MDELGAGDEGAVRIGPTDHGMVRIIVVTRQGRVELDYAPQEAREIADELAAAAAIAESATPKRRR
ncbi:MAG: DUF6324 family protein [Pseudomonadota bacterium]